MRPGRHASIVLALVASGCTPEIASTTDDSAYKTLVIGTYTPEGWKPVLIDLTQERERIVYSWSRARPPPLAYWTASVEELRLVVPVQAAPPSACSALRLPLRTADKVECQLDETGFGDCAPDALYVVEDWAVLARDWETEPDPCEALESFDRHAVISFDVQTTRVDPQGDDVTAGAGTLAVPVGPGQVVLGQLSGWLDERYPHPNNTEIGLFESSAVLTSLRAPVPRTSTRTSTAWISGALREEGVAWLGSEHTALGSFDGHTGRISAVIPPLVNGRIIDMDSDPGDRERVLVATSSCSLHLREGGANSWITLVPPIQGLDGPRYQVCEPRVHFAGPGYALVVGLPAVLPGEGPPDRLRFRDRLDRVIEVRGSRIATLVMPWPALDDPIVGRSLRGVATFVDASGGRLAVVGGAQYTRVPALDSPPYDFGAGQGMFFLRRVDSPDAPWTPLATEPAEKGMSDRGPVLIGDLHELVGTFNERPFSGLLIGAHTTVYVYDPVRAARRAESAIQEIEQGWQPIAHFPLVTRVRPDGDGGFVIVTGDLYRNARVDLQRRFHWWRPID